MNKSQENILMSTCIQSLDRFFMWIDIFDLGSIQLLFL